MTERTSAESGDGLRALEREMARQHEDALASVSAAEGRAGAIATAIRERRRLVLLGMGGSHAVNRMAEVEYRALGIHAVALTLSEQLYSPLDLKESAVILTSQSGESAEVVRAIEFLRGHPAAFGLTLEGGSTIARMLPSLVGAGGTEQAFAATRSLTVTLALHLAILAELGLDARPALEMLRAKGSVDVGAALELLRGCRTVLFSARSLRGLAEAVALVTMELGRMPAYALEGGQLRHGPMEILGPEVGVVLFSTDEPAAGLNRSMVRDTIAAKSPTVLFDASGQEGMGGDVTLRFPPAQGLAAIFSLLPSAQRLAIGLACQRVSDVGTPQRSTKITRVE
jgi:fructoselysine-6-P-deglycase FrlB-like protein